MVADQSSRESLLASALIGDLTNAEVAARLGLSVRQVRRLKGVLLRRGSAGLIHGNRGRRSPRRLPDELRARVVGLARTVYAGSNHSELARLLAQREGIVLTRSTLRRVLLEASLPSPYRRRRPRLPAATLPVAVDLVQRRLTALDLQGADFREPSFQQAVDRRRRERPDALRLEMDLDVFAAAARLDPGRPPDGFIFSIGPYDAARLAAMLSAPDEHLVVKESPVVNTLLAALLNATDAMQRREREALLALMLPFMFRPSRGTERRLFFKFSSWNMCAAATLLRLFPSAPAICVFRPVESTVGSMLARPPGWHDLIGRPRPAQARLFPSIAALPAQSPLSATTFFAHTWRSGVEQVLALPADRVLLIDHNELVARPIPTLERLLAHLGLGPEPSLTVTMATGQAAPAREPLPAPLTPQQAEEVRAVVGGLPGRLAKRYGLGGVGDSPSGE